MSNQQLLKELVLIKELVRTDIHKYRYGIFKNGNNRKVFVKMLNGGSQMNRVWMLNEIQVYKLISEIVSKHNPPYKIRPPKLEGYSVSKNEALLVLEYVDGSNGHSLSSEKKSEVFQEALDLLSWIYENLSVKDRKKLVVRNSWHILVLTILNYLKAVLRYPKLTFKLSKGVLSFLSGYPYLVIDGRKALLHRDLGDWNLICSKGGKVYLTDFQLACVGHPHIDLAVILLKSWNDKEFRDLFFKSQLYKDTQHTFVSRSILKAISIYQAIYDLSLSDGGDPKSAVEFLVHFSSLPHMPNVKRTLSRLLLLLLKSPKDFLLSLFFSPSTRYKEKPYTNKLSRVSEEVLQKLKRTVPSLPIHFVGSASLKIAGRGDLDLFVECPTNSQRLCSAKISRVFGKPTKTRSSFVEWNFVWSGVPVELSLVDPQSSILKNQLNIYSILRNNLSVLLEYEKIKKQLNGLSTKEYVIRRMEFFNDIIKKYSKKND